MDLGWYRSWIWRLCASNLTGETDFGWPECSCRELCGAGIWGVISPYGVLPGVRWLLTRLDGDATSIGDGLSDVFFAEGGSLTSVAGPRTGPSLPFMGGVRMVSRGGPVGVPWVGVRTGGVFVVDGPAFTVFDRADNIPKGGCWLWAGIALPGWLLGDGVLRQWCGDGVVANGPTERRPSMNWRNWEFSCIRVWIFFSASSFSFINWASDTEFPWEEPIFFWRWATKRCLWFFWKSITCNKVLLCCFSKSAGSVKYIWISGFIWEVTGMAMNDPPHILHLLSAIAERQRSQKMCPQFVKLIERPCPGWR